MHVFLSGCVCVCMYVYVCDSAHVRTMNVCMYVCMYVYVIGFGKTLRMGSARDSCNARF